MDKRAIARALKTKATQAPQTQGMASGVTGMGALADYGAWNYGMAFGNSLPRTAETFMSGAFSPLTPIMPVGIDQADSDSGRPKPRRMQYPVGWNMPVGVPGTEGLKLVTFANLRMYADAYSVVRACIQVRKEEILGLDWDIVPTDEAQRKMRGDADAHADFQKRRREAIDFFHRPDPNFHDFTGWMGAVLEDVLVVDALAVYLHPSRVPGKGVLGSDLAALEVLDGTTIRPLLDIRGGSPRPPAPAYQQYLYGVPRTDMMDIILQSDIEEMDEAVAEYRGDQLLYLPYTRRSWTPYGFPGIERAILPVMTGLKRQQFQLDYFSEGTIPGQFVVPGDDISTPSQIRQLQDTLNAIAGDQAWKHKIIVLPRGSSTQPQKPIDLASQFDEQLITNICMAYDVMPMELGIMGGAKGQSPNQTNQMAQASEEISKRKALKPMLQWLKSAIFDHILQDICEQDDMQWAWVGLESINDEEQKAANFKALTSIGLLSIDEARVQMGLSPWGLPLTSDPVYMSATGVSTLGTVDPNVAETYFDEPPIVQGAAAAAGSQPLGQEVSTGTGGQPAAPPGATGASGGVSGQVQGAQPVASVGTPGAGGRPPGGGGGAPVVQPPAAGTSTPLHGDGADDDEKDKKDKAVKKAIAGEFDALRRYLKKGRNPEQWQPEFISKAALLTVADTLDRGADLPDAINAGKRVMKSAERLARRDDATMSAATSVVSNLGSLAGGITDANVGPIQFVDQGVAALRDGYLQVMHDAARHAADDHSNVSAVVPGGFHEHAAARAEAQRNFLAGMAKDVLAGRSDAQINQRLNLYARSLVPAYESAYGMAVTTGMALGNAATPPDPTEASAANEPDPYSIETYTPENDTEAGDIGTEAGDEEFSNEFADEFNAPDATEVDSDTGIDGLSALDELALGLGVGAVLSDELMSDDGTMEGDAPPDFEEAPRGYIIWHAEGEGSDSYEPCDLCQERDGQTYTMETLPCWPGDGGFGEFCDGAANCNCWLEYTDEAPDGASEIATNPFREWSTGFYAQRLAEENALDAQATAARAADIAAVREVNPEAAARMEARDALYGTPQTRYGPDGRYDPSGPRYESAAEPDLTKVNDAIHARTLFKAGSADALAAWYESGADGQINWGEEGDFDACVAIAGQYINDPEGYCQLRHMAATGQTTSEHAAEDKVSKAEIDTYTPPQGVRAEAKRALEWIKQGHAGDGFTDTGRKRASDLAAGHAVSLDTVKRIASFLARHEVDKHGAGWSPGHPEFPSPGRVSWAAWGGDPAKSWVEGILSSKSKVTKDRVSGQTQAHGGHGYFTSGSSGSSPDSEPNERGYSTTTPERFKAQFDEFIAANPDYSAFVTHYTLDEMREMTPVVTNGGLTGCLIHDHGDGRVEATALFNMSGVRGAGEAMLTEAVEHHGVNYVECYGPRLNEIYAKVGFDVVSKDAFNAEWAAPDWNHEKFDSPDYYTMRLKMEKTLRRLKMAFEDVDMSEIDGKAADAMGPEWAAKYGEANRKASLMFLGENPADHE